ncbi:MAG: MAPEG family protein [Pseudomonadota bacterium]
MEFPLYITGFATVLLAILHLSLTFNVIFKRRSDKIVHGDNNDKTMMKRIRGHANASEQIPIALITMALAEWVLPGWWIAAIASLLVIGRIIHGVYFAQQGLPHQLRVFGMLFTLFAQIGSITTLTIGLIFS